MPRPDWPDLKITSGLGNGAGSIIYRVQSQETGETLACKHVTRGSIVYIEEARTGDSRELKALKVTRKYVQSFLNQVKNEYAILKDFQQKAGSPNVMRVSELRPVRKGFRLHGYDLLMEHVEGEGLKDAKQYTMAEKVDFLRQAAQGLVALHQQQIIHADLKPAHLMITPQGLVKLIDFGLSCYSDTEDYKIHGTPEYMAPEQVKAKKVDFRTDVYGLGASMYWILTGRMNRPAMTGVPGAVGLDFTVSYAGRSRSVRNDNPKVPKELDDLVIACCERKPEKRPQSMGEVLKALEAIQKRNVIPKDA